MPYLGKETGEWRRLPKEKLRDFYSSTYTITLIKLRRKCGTSREKRNTCRVLMGKPKKRRTRGITLRRR
jgi:hypothetical protein